MNDVITVIALCMVSCGHSVFKQANYGKNLRQGAATTKKCRSLPLQTIMKRAIRWVPIIRRGGFLPAPFYFLGGRCLPVFYDRNQAVKKAGIREENRKEQRRGVDAALLSGVTREKRRPHLKWGRL